MPQQYTRAQLLEAARTDHPQFRKIPDNELFAAIAQDHPDLAKGISELNAPEFQSPRYTGTTGDTVLKGMENVATGVKNFIPNTAKALVEVVNPIDRNISLFQKLRSPKQAVMGAVRPAVTLAQQGMEAAVGALPDSLQRGVRAQVQGEAPGLLVDVPGPDDPRTAEMQQAAGANLAATLAVPAMEGAVKAGAPVFQKIRGMAPTPEGLIQRATANRVAAAEVPPSSVPTTKTGVVVSAAKRAAAPVRRAIASVEEKAALRLAGDAQQPLVRGAPEVGSNAFMPENLTRPPDAPVVPRSADFQAGPVNAPPQSGPVNIPRPSASEIPQIPKAEAPAITAPELNKWMNVREKQLVYGTNPAEQIIADGLLGADKASTLENVSSARRSVGSQMEAAFKAAEEKGLRFDLDTEIQQAIADAKKTYGKGSDEAFMKQLDGLQDQFVQHNGDLKSATPSEAHSFEKDLSKGINFDSASTSDVVRVMKDIRGRINRLLKTGVDDIADLKDRWGNLYEAEKSLKSSIRKDEIGRGTGASPQTAFQKMRSR